MSENRVKEARERAGVTIKQLADLIGAPYRTVQDWNAGKSKPVEWAERLIIEKLDSLNKEQSK